MVRTVNIIKKVFILFVFSILTLLVYGFYTVPDEIYSVSDSKADLGLMYSISYDEAKKMAEKSKAIADDGKYKVNIRLFNAIPIKSSVLTISRRQYVVVSGEIFGLRIFTSGVVIVGIDSVETENGKVSPGENAGLKKGDRIISVDGEKIESCVRLSEIFLQKGPQSMHLVFMRGNEQHECDFSLSFSVSQGQYRGGLWIRDSAAGIGTMTYFDPSSGMFAGLGHGVCDVDTGEILPLENGDIVPAQINGCYKGKQGEAGELCGTFNGDSFGTLSLNSNRGVYGYLSSKREFKEKIPVATDYEVKEGKAQIISTVDKNGPEYYDIEITKITADGNLKSMVIKVTDNELIEKTGGIVQGMSGSPIIQNGMLVGAITHVFINDPLQGYAIFAQYMIETSRIIEQGSLQKAS